MDKLPVLFSLLLKASKEMHKHYIQQSVKVTKSSTGNAGGAVFRACPLNTLFFISLWLLHCEDHSWAGTPPDVSVPIFTASQQVTGAVSSPSAEGRSTSRKTELKRSALGEGWSYQPLSLQPQGQQVPDWEWALLQQWTHGACGNLALRLHKRGFSK